MTPPEGRGSRADPFEEIARLKKERNAILLAHYYQEPDIQDVADVIGDSLYLSQQAAKTTADVIVFAGVHFMAETAKILNPSRKVVLPDLEAGCSLDEGCPADAFAAFKARHPGHVVVSYVNCSAAVKALSDVICTSANAEKIVRSIPADRPILFAPDRNLGAYIVRKTGRDMVLWPGTCVVHEVFSEKKLVQLRVEHPDAIVLAHPECEEAILRHADVIASTTGLLTAARAASGSTLIVATEPGILHQMRKENPDKALIPAPPEGECSCSECPHMRRNTLEKVQHALETLEPEITLPEDLRVAALRPILRMLELS